MCKFFSCISRKGLVKFFKPEDIVQIMASGNPESYDFNSHASLMHFLGIKADKESQWTKWEYNPESKELNVDDCCPEDDRKSVQKAMDAFFKGKDVLFLRNLYGGNSGSWNSGDRNSGSGNSGSWNSGDWNSGDRNSGNWNSGDGNSGSGNSGDRNSGDGNSGSGNSGSWNSGDGNSGSWNSGSGNSGDRNSGDGNSGNGVLNSFCTKQAFMLFDKPCTKEEYGKTYQLDWSWFWINKWISESDMTDDEKKANPTYKTCGGYLKTIEYKEAFKACPDSFKDAVKKLANFDAEKFFEISGLRI